MIYTKISTVVVLYTKMLNCDTLEYWALLKIVLTRLRSLVYNKQ